MNCETVSDEIPANKVKVSFARESEQETRAGNLPHKTSPSMSITLRFQARERSLTGVDTDPSATPVSSDTDGIVEEEGAEPCRMDVSAGRVSASASNSLRFRILRIN